MFNWESAKVSHKTVFALLTPEIQSYEMAQMLSKPVFALPGCQRMSGNTLLCNTLALADQSQSKNSSAIENFNPGVSFSGAPLVYRKGLDRKFQSTIDRSQLSSPKAAIEFFNPWALWAGPSRITQLIPQEFSGVTEVICITPSNSLRVFWCKDV